MTNRWHEPNYQFIILLMAVIVFGLVMLSSASAIAGLQEPFNDQYYFVKRQLLYGLLIGLPTMWVMSRIDYHVWKRYAFPIVVVNAILLGMVIVPGIGASYLGASRWIHLGSFLFQPSEFMKLSFLLYLGIWLEAREKSRTIHDAGEGFIPFMIMIGFLVLMIAGIQKDLGTTVVIAVIAITVYYAAGAPWKHLGLIAASGAGVLFLLVKILPIFFTSFAYRANRLTVFLNPGHDPLGVGFHINQALLAIGSGGIFGVGLGHSRQKFNYLPEVSTDSIFAVISEEMGFLFAIGLVALYLGLMWHGLAVARKAPDPFGKIVAIGITTWITFQAVVNIMAMLSLLPLTGIPLPFVSYGSTSMATLLIAVGILINISRQTKT